VYIVLSFYYSGDIILGVNDKDVHSVRDVLDEIGLEVGKQLDLRVMRSDQERYVTLITAPETAKRF
jgi:S1-C subfamily serine protease